MKNFYKSLSFFLISVSISTSIIIVNTQNAQALRWWLFKKGDCKVNPFIPVVKAVCPAVGERGPVVIPIECWTDTIMFEHPYLEGSRVQLSQARIRLNELRSQGINDKTSSICLPPGWGVQVFQHDNYQGNARFFDNPSDQVLVIPDLRDIGWNDSISSIRLGVVRSR